MNDQFEADIELRMTRSVQFIKKNPSQDLKNFSSIETKRSSEGILYDYCPKLSPTREYLKKGTSINKSVLNNIIRMKLSRHNTNSKKGPDQEI